MPDKMNLDDHKLLYYEFKKYEIMTMSVVGGQPKKHANPSHKATKHIERTQLQSLIISQHTYTQYNAVQSSLCRFGHANGRFSGTLQRRR